MITTLMTAACSKEIATTAPAIHDPGSRLEVPALGISFLSPSDKPVKGPIDLEANRWGFTYTSGFTAMIVQNKSYDEPPAGVWDQYWKISTASYEEFSREPSCNAFLNDSLPIDLQRKHLCDVSHTSDGHSVVYGIGFAADDPRESVEDTRGQAYLDSMVIVPLQDRAVVFFHLNDFVQTHNDVQKIWDEYVQEHPNRLDWTKSNWQEANDLTAKELERKLQQPSPEIRSTQALLKDIAESIEIIQ